MFFIVNHAISNVPEFWGAAQRELPNLPAGIRVHLVFPNAAGDAATCLWECGDQATLEGYLEAQTGAFAKNSYLAVDASKAMGLPAV